MWHTGSRQTSGTRTTAGVSELEGEQGWVWRCRGALASTAGARVLTGWLPTLQSPMKVLQLSDTSEVPPTNGQSLGGVLQI